MTLEAAIQTVVKTCPDGHFVKIFASNEGVSMELIDAEGTPITIRNKVAIDKLGRFIQSAVNDLTGIERG